MVLTCRIDSKSINFYYKMNYPTIPEIVHVTSGLQPKTFKTFILMVKPLKPLFFSEKPLKTFI